MSQVFTDHAIKLALEQRWDEAIAVNIKLLKINSKNVNALKRTAYAYLKLHKTKKATEYYNKVLAIDKDNPIAIKSLHRIKSYSKQNMNLSNNNQCTSTANIFLEEPGRTKIISLAKLASNKIIFCMCSAQKVHMIPKKRSIEIRDDQKNYLGVLPDDISHRLIKLIDGGNQYETYVKTVGNNELSVFIKEIKRGKKFNNIPSFSNNVQTTYTPFVRKDLITVEKPDVKTPEEQ